MHIQNGILFICIKDWNIVTYDNMDETGGHYVKWNMPSTESEIHTLYHIYSHKKAKKKVGFIKEDNRRVVIRD